MRRHIALGTVAVLCIGCAIDQPAPTQFELSVPVFAAGGNKDANFGTHMNGAEEVPVRDTRAQGQAIFRVSDDGMSVRYKLIVANIENVFQAHIHQAPSGVNGPIVQWLYPGIAPPAGLTNQGRIDGVIAEGTFTAANFIGPLAGQSISAFLAAVRSGALYVNVHTSDGAAPADTGPGDFPGGEIRGQVVHGSSHANH